MTLLPTAGSSVVHPAPLVTVRGQATLLVDPDRVSVSAGVTVFAATAAAARAALGARQDAVRAVLAEHAQATSRSHTDWFRVSPVYQHKLRNRITQYVGSMSTTVVLSDFEHLSDLVIGLSSVAECSVAGPTWTLEPGNPAHRTARVNAIADARLAAADCAAAFGAELVGLAEVSDLSEMTLGMVPLSASSRMFAQASTTEPEPEFDFEPQQQTVSAEVTVRFYLSSPDLSA